MTDHLRHLVDDATSFKNEIAMIKTQLEQTADKASEVQASNEAAKAQLKQAETSDLLTKDNILQVLEESI